MQPRTMSWVKHRRPPVRVYSPSILPDGLCRILDMDSGEHHFLLGTLVNKAALASIVGGANGGGGSSGRGGRRQPATQARFPDCCRRCQGVSQGSCHGSRVDPREKGRTGPWRDSAL